MAVPIMCRWSGIARLVVSTLPFAWALKRVPVSRLVAAAHALPGRAAPERHGVREDRAARVEVTEEALTGGVAPEACGVEPARGLGEVPERAFPGATTGTEVVCSTPLPAPVQWCPWVTGGLPPSRRGLGSSHSVGHGPGRRCAEDVRVGAAPMHAPQKAHGLGVAQLRGRQQPAQGLGAIGAASITIGVVGVGAGVAAAADATAAAY